MLRGRLQFQNHSSDLVLHAEIYNFVGGMGEGSGCCMGMGLLCTTNHCTGFHSKGKHSRNQPVFCLPFWELLLGVSLSRGVTGGLIGEGVLVPVPGTFDPRVVECKYFSNLSASLILSVPGMSMGQIQKRGHNTSGANSNFEKYPISLSDVSNRQELRGRDGESAMKWVGDLSEELWFIWEIYLWYMRQKPELKSAWDKKDKPVLEQIDLSQRLGSVWLFPSSPVSVLPP